jgi:sulfoxide reductase heme-binding subunit YedZ
MKLTLEKALVYLLPVLLTAAILLVAEKPTTHGINRTLALSGLAILSITFLIGPLSMFSKRINRLKLYRKYLGLAGFAIIFLHAAISFWLFYSLDLNIAFNPASPLLSAALSGTAALLILLAMAVTSTQSAMRMMGRNWKLLQNTGYIAMVLSITHFAWSQLGLKGVIATNMTAWIVFIIAVIVVVVRVAVYIASKRKQK